MENKPFNYNPISINLQAKKKGLQCTPINYLVQLCSQLLSSELYVQLGFNFLCQTDTFARILLPQNVKDI